MERPLEQRRRPQHVLVGEDAADDRLDVAAGPRELAGDVVHERRRRVVVEQPAQHLARNEPGGARVIGEDPQDVEAVVDAAAGRDRYAEHQLRVVVVAAGVVEEAAGTAVTGVAVAAPAGERPRHLDHVLLRVAAVDAERVQFHQLAGVVLVRRGPRAVRVVQVGQHRRAGSAADEQLEEVGQRQLAEDLAILEHLVDADGVDVGVEVIAPELHHPLEQLPVRIDRARDRRLGELAGHQAGVERVERASGASTRCHTPPPAASQSGSAIASGASCQSRYW